MTAPLFTIDDLSVTFHKGRQPIKAVDQISFTIEPGQRWGWLANRGSAKPPRVAPLLVSGHFRRQRALFGSVNSAFFRTERKQFRRQVQMVFQNPFASLNPRQKVADIIAEGIDNFHLAGSHQERMDQVLQLLAQVGLPPDAINRFPHEFSGGQRQRIGIARALAVQPKFLVLDEPISALDVSIQAQIVNLLRRIQKEQQLTYLFIAHDLSMVHYISDKIVVMYRGRIVEAGATEAVYRHPLHPYTQTLLASVPQADPIFEQQKTHVQFDHEPIAPTANLVEAAPEHWVLAAQTEA